MCRKLGTNNILDIAIPKTYKEDVEIRYTNSFKQRYYPIFVALMVDYE